MDSLTLMYFPSGAIVEFMAAHPVSWQDIGLAKLGKVGDSAGRTPTPAVYEFLALLRQRRELFSQQEYAEHCFRLPAWQEWLARCSEEQRRGVAAKLRCNFYVSMITTLHAWALLSESGQFDSCFMNSAEDVLDKRDLTVKTSERVMHLALVGPKGDSEYTYKSEYRRGFGGQESLKVQLPKARKRGPGNLMWYELHDFHIIIEGLGPPPEPPKPTIIERIRQLNFFE